MKSLRRGFEGVGHALQRRGALGLQPLTAPLLLFIPLGLAAGPWGLGLVSERTLARLDVVVTPALAALGIFIGVAGTRQGLAMPRLFVAATLEAGVTVAVAAGAVFLLLGRWGVPLELPATVVALALGISASASAAPAIGHHTMPEHETAARVADLDDVLPVLLWGLVLGVSAGGSGPAAAALAVAVGVGTGVCGWLLFDSAEGAAERTVFVLGCVALAGGAAAYAGASALLSGMLTGSFWTLAPGRTDRLVADDLRKIQHPLVVLLLITAGASIVPDLLGVWLLVPYVTFRLAGKLIGGWTASRLAPELAPSDLGTYLVAPGVLGIAFSLNLAQVAGPAADPVVFAVAAGAIACELLTIFVIPGSRAF